MFLILSGLGLNAQTILHSQEIELLKPWDDQQLITTAHGNSYFTWITDKKTTSLFRYNNAFFLRDSLSVARPDKKYSFIAGYSFRGEIPVIHWASDNLENILSVEYDLNNRSTSQKAFVFTYENETLISSFTHNGQFYMLTLADKEAKLVLYTFNKPAPEPHVIDLSKHLFSMVDAKEFSLNALLRSYPLVLVDPDLQNPLSVTSARSKLYTFDDKLLLTFDHNRNYTEIIEINLPDFSLNEKKIPQPELTEVTVSNSFLSTDRLYQIRASRREFILGAKSYPDLAELNSFRTSEDQEIGFKNSPLLAQILDQRPYDLGKTKKFMRRLSESSPGLSATPTTGGTLLTVGGIRGYRSAGDVILGVGLIAAGGNTDIFDDGSGQSQQTIFFESIFDKNFQHVSAEQHPLASDFISEFLSANEHIGLYTVTRSKGEFILSYYEPREKKLILRKFRNGRPY